MLVRGRSGMAPAGARRTAPGRRPRGCLRGLRTRAVRSVPGGSHPAPPAQGPRSRPRGLAGRTPPATCPARPLLLDQLRRRPPPIPRVRRPLPLALAPLQRQVQRSRTTVSARDQLVTPEQPPPRQLAPERRFDRPRPRRPLVLVAQVDRR